MKLYKHPYIFIKQSPEPRFGVFSSVFIAAKTILEECHYATIGDGLFNESLKGYTYNYESPSGVKKQIIPLGYGAIYNHNINSNAEWFIDYDRDLVIFVSTKNIFKGQQIYISYGENFERTFDFNQL